MSLPPISHLTRNDQALPRKCLYYKFSSSTTSQALNPILSLKSKLLSPGGANSKAFEVMSPNPPPCLNNSKFSISRLSPPLPVVRPPAKKSINSYLKRKYIDYLELDRKSDVGVSFTRPIRDYFQETVEVHHKIPEGDTKSEVAEYGLTPPQIVFKEQKYMKPKYSSVVMPLPRDADKIVSKEIRNQKAKEKKQDKKMDLGPKITHQSLQTDNFNFDFDEWEFDYDA